MPREEELIKVRKEKLETIRKGGNDPYPSFCKRDYVIEKVLKSFSKLKSKSFYIVGRVTSVRTHGKIAFLDLVDGSGKIQLYLSKKDMGKIFNFLDKLDLGDFIQVKGSPYLTKRGEKSLAIKDIVILSKSLRPVPETFYGLKDIEERYRKRYLDLLANPGVIDTFKVRGKIIIVIRDFLKDNDFIEVETPVLQPLYGGALARPFTTTHNVLKEKLYLRIAPELYLKRLVIGGLERVYEIGKNFRNEGISTTHNPEFTMLELYVAYFSYHELMKFTERMVVEIVKDIKGKSEFEYQSKRIKLKAPFKRISYRDIVKKCSGIDIDKTDTLPKLKKEIKNKNIKVKVSKDISWGKLVDELFKETTRKNIHEPTFVIDYPVELNPLAKRKADDPSKIERFQLYIGGLELGNAFSELNDPEDQYNRFKEQERFTGDEKHEIDKDYIEALEYGMPPTAGLGIGIDRLVMLLTNHDSIREVVLFPALKKKKD